MNGKEDDDPPTLSFSCPYAERIAKMEVKVNGLLWLGGACLTGIIGIILLKVFVHT